MKQDKQLLEFGAFQVDPVERTLRRDGVPIPLPPKAFDTLLVLLENSGTVVNKGDLLEQVWPETFVEENNLTQYISLLRRVLGDDRHSQIYIQTASRRGYRFCGPVRQVCNGDNTSGPKPLPEQAGLVLPPGSQAEEPAWAENVVPAAPPGAPANEDFRSHRVLLSPAVITILVAAAVWAIGSSHRRASPLPLRSRLIAVLPFKVADAADRDDSLGLAMADDLIHQLGARMTVPPVTSIYRLQDAELNRAGAARQLGVGTLLTGQVGSRGERIQVSIQLVNASDGAIWWKQNFSGDRRNFFGVQDAMAAAVNNVFFIQAAAPPPVKRYTHSMPAYGAYVAGRFFWNQRTSAGLYKSINHFERAISLDPDFALAYAGLADAYAFDLEKWPKAESTARQALHLDSTLGEAHASLGFVRMAWNQGAAEPEFKKAIELSPRYATAHQWYAIDFASRGRILEAREEMRQALELDPYSGPINADMAQMYYFSHEYDLAEQQCQRALAIDPNFLNTHLYLHDIYIQKGMNAQAMDEYFTIQKLAGGSQTYSPAEEPALRAAYKASGIRGFWQSRVAYLKASRADDRHLAEYLARLGRNQEAMYWLDRASRQDELFGRLAYANPAFDGLHANPRFQELVFKKTKSGHRVKGSENGNHLEPANFHSLQ